MKEIEELDLAASLAAFTVSSISFMSELLNSSPWQGISIDQLKFSVTNFIKKVLPSNRQFVTSRAKENETRS